MSMALLLFCLMASAEDVSNKMDEIMSLMRNNEVVRYEYDYFTAPGNAVSTIVSAGRYYTDSLPKIRCQAYKYASVAALQSGSDSAKMMVVEDLLRSCDDSSSIVVQNAWQELTKFDKKYYTEESKRRLEHIIDDGKFFSERFFLIGGYVGSENMVSILKNRRALCEKNLQWYVDVALCRLNDNSSVQTILTCLSKIRPSLDFVDLLLPDLLYTRQREIYDWIIKEAMTDECKCVSRSPVSERQIPCAYYIMYEIADYIDGFPIERDEDGEKDDDFSKSDIKNMRTWLGANLNYRIIDAGY